MGVFSDRIRARAAEVAKKPITPTGATAAMAKQAAVSSTGKAAAPGTGLAQSSVQETVAAEQAQTQQDAIADEVQASGEKMAMTEKAADVKQAGVESGQRQQKLASDNKFNNQLAEFTSRISKAADQKEADIQSLELKGQLQNDRLNNQDYTNAIKNKGRDLRLESVEDHAIFMSQQGLERGKILDADKRKMDNWIKDQNRVRGKKEKLDELMTNTKTTLNNIRAQEKAQKVGFIVDAAKMGYNATPDGTIPGIFEDTSGFDGGDTSGPKDRHGGN